MQKLCVVHALQVIFIQKKIYKGGQKNMEALYWVGKYESDIEHCAFFNGSITYYGSNQGNNYAFCKNDIRISSKYTDEYKHFVIYMIEKLISKNINCKFMFYNQSLAHDIIACHPTYLSHVVGLNNSFVINSLNNKLYNRLWISNIIDTIPVKVFSKNECSYKNIKKAFPKYSSFIVQKNISSGGKGTYLLSSDNEKNILAELENNELYIVSPYISNMYSINIHVCISDIDTIQFPISLQLSKEVNNKILFCGSDYIAARKIESEIKNRINSTVEKICKMLQSFGYRGILGIDLMVNSQHIYFIEINPRFQGSSLPLSKSLVNAHLPSLYEIHLDAFSNKISNKIKGKINNLEVNYSLLIYKNFSRDNYLSELYIQMEKNSDLYIVSRDGYNPQMHIDYNAYTFRALIRSNISHISPDNRINMVENLMNNDYLEFPVKSTDDIILLKISLLIQGVKLSTEAFNYISSKNTIKNATFNAIDVSIFNGLKINCPTKIQFSDLTPYHIEYDLVNKLQLYYKHAYVSNIEVDINENILDRKTSLGIPYSSIGFKTNDRVRIRHTSVCYFKEHNQSCSFCESKHKKSYNFSDSDIYEVIDAYEKEVDFRHYLIGGASEKDDLEPLQIKKIIQYIRKKSSKPIYLMSLPPKDISHIYDYYQLGLNEIAFNLEIYDRKTALAIMPGKGKIPLSQYMNALEESTKYFGKTGNVRSMLIVGLEREESLINGVKALCNIGVSPMLSVFRPMPLTTMNNIIPPTIKDVSRIYHIADNICRQYGLFLGPTCDQCQNNTLSLSTKYR